MQTSYSSAVEQIVQTVFSTMVEMDLQSMEEQDCQGADYLAASIHITGEWMGSVVLSLSPTLSTISTSRLLQMSVDEVNDNDRQDVAAELVNMIGGNLKSVLPGPSFLSLPTVVMGERFGVHVPDTVLTDDVFLGGDNGYLRVRIYVKPAAGQ